MKLYPSIFSFAFLLFAVSSFAQFEIPAKSDTPNAPVGPMTTIEFENNEYDFGVIEQGDKVKYTYTLTNTGNEPLIITNAKGSCGCTVPSWPKEPIFPGEQADIEVEFNSKGKKGKQSKRVTITANTDPAQTFLTIKGEIVVPEPEIDIDQNKPVESIASWREKHSDSNPDCIALYPNPTSETLKLDIKEHTGKSAQIMIYNDLGQATDNRTVDSITKSSINFDVSQYQPGIYTITIMVDGEKPSSRCFVVANR